MERSGTPCSKKTGILGKLSSQLEISANLNNLLLEKLQYVERTANGNAQYARKETFEVHGLPANLPDENVEQVVLNIMNDIKADETPAYTLDDIQACHKLKDKTKAICKMVSSKRMRQVISSRTNLKGPKS